MIALRNALAVMLLFGLFLYSGIRVIRMDGGKKEVAVYTVLVVWCAYMALSAMFGWVHLNVAEFRKAVYTPIGNLMERVIFKETPS